MLEYGDMMQEYARVAGLPRRRMIVVPFLTPTIASRWVRTVTPIRGNIAGPLIESLECDAVCRDHSVDEIIDPPEGGLTSYADALKATLDRTQRGDANVEWANASAEVPAFEPLPSDPEWAGETTFEKSETREVDGARNDVFARISPPTGRWETVAKDAPQLVKYRSYDVGPGTAFIEYRLEPVGDNRVRIVTRAQFYPRGLAGLAYWRLGTPLRALGLAAADPFR